MSIYDGNLTYWSKRLKLMPGLSESKRKLLNKQKGICPLCLDTLFGMVMKWKLTILFQYLKVASEYLQTFN